MSSSQSLQSLRKLIDEIDDELLRLMNSRLDLAEQVGKIKASSDIAIEHSDREQEILDRLKADSDGNLEPEQIDSIFKSFFQFSKDLQNKLNLPQRASSSSSRQPSVCVVGLGLMGGSLALALKKSYKIYAYDIKPVRSKEITNVEFDDIFSFSLVVLAMPIQKIKGFLKEHGHRFSSGTVILDLGSTKHSVVKMAEEFLPEGVSFIGGHPLAGKKSHGFMEADPSLFNDKAFVLCPGKVTMLSKSDTTNDNSQAVQEIKESASALEMARELVETLGAIPVVMTAKHHDEVLATSSHLPHFIAVALSLSAKGLGFKHENFQGFYELFPRSYHDATRVASAHYDIWKDIAQTNHQQITEAAEAFQLQMSYLLSLLESGEFKQAFLSAAEFQNHFEKCKSNIYKEVNNDPHSKKRPHKRTVA